MASSARSRMAPTCLHSPDHNTLYLMAAALGLKDKYTQAHGQRVAVYACRLARRIGLSDKVMPTIAMGGMLHDVGKLALSDRIFSDAKAAFSEDMLSELQSHPLTGAELLKSIPDAENILDIVLFHHERIDGSGYPFGYKGDTIPLNARIVSVADCFDAITTDRPYQQRKSCAYAIGALKEMAGSYLTADLVDAFVEDIENHGMASHKCGGIYHEAAFGRSLSATVDR